MNRRRSLQLMAAAAAYAQLVRCGIGKGRSFPIKVNGSNAERGHLLRTAAVDEPGRTVDVPVLIVGAGISGLSAARALAQQGMTDFLVLDLEGMAGGHARGGANAAGAFPLGAHYLPIPDNNDVELIAFLKECGIITGTDANGLPVYGEEHLCGVPQERLFDRGVWRSGIRPQSGLSTAEEEQFLRFERYVAQCEEAKGSDGRWAFAIPVDASSTAGDVEAYRALDGLTFGAWMQREGYTGEAMRWYLNYCCLDDFGAPADQVSAWAGLHYFAARRGQAANAEPGSILTWPEGNSYLVRALEQHVGDRMRSDQLALAVRAADGAVEVDVRDFTAGGIIRYRAKQVILCVPQFVTARLLGGEQATRAADLQYAPWVVVNVTLDRAPEERGGEPMAWDNVRYGSGTLGYVNACHQRLDQPPGLILTHYRALTGATPREARERAHTQEAEDWVNEALAELEVLHPDIRDRITEAEVAVWGHGMIVPVPGLLHGPLRKALARPLGDRIHFAHSDLSGMSLFEEAFHQGLRAAREVLQQRSRI
jgi:protoporphyrinogen oxidase